MAAGVCERAAGLGVILPGHPQDITVDTGVAVVGICLSCFLWRFSRLSQRPVLFCGGRDGTVAKDFPFLDIASWRTTTPSPQVS
jgi:hypothetical protein